MKLSFYRCGLVISDQHQPGPVMLPPGPGRQNVQRSGPSIRWCQVAQGHARIFHPTCIKAVSRKESHYFWSVSLVVILSHIFKYYGLLILHGSIQLNTIKMPVRCNSHYSVLTLMLLLLTERFSYLSLCFIINFRCFRTIITNCFDLLSTQLSSQILLSSH